MTNEPRHWERAVTKYGAATVIALFLVWFLTNGLSSDLKAMRDTLRDHVAETNHLLFQICINTSQTEQQRAGCRE